MMFQMATGGGAFKFADLFKEKLGIVFDKEDEMHSLVCGVNFLLKVGFFLLYLIIISNRLCNFCIATNP